MSIVRLGIIGAGRFGKHYVRLAQTVSGASLQGVFDRHTGSLQKFLNDPELDAVIVAAPPSTHFELVKAALVAGKHVLVEKPMVLNSRDARALAQLVKKSKRVCMVGFQYVYNDHIRAIKALLQKKSLGSIKYIFAQNLYYTPIRYDVGSFVDAGVHELSILEYLFNLKGLKKITGTSLSFADKKRDDFTAVTLQGNNGIKAHIITSWFAPEKVRRLTIVGSKASLVYDSFPEEKITVFQRPYPGKKQGDSLSFFAPEEWRAPGQEVPVVRRESLVNEVEHFLHCIAAGSKPLTDVAFGSTIVEYTEKIQAKVQTIF